MVEHQRHYSGQRIRRLLHSNASRGIIGIGCCLLSLLSFTAAAQEVLKNPYFVPKVVPQAPNTAALGKYGDYTVSLIHGLPTISIPLYEVRAGAFALPVTLNYHASGIKVTDMASWAGLVSGRRRGRHAQGHGQRGRVYCGGVPFG